MRSVANAYLETQVMTASAERLHLMVVDAAIRFALQAEQAIAAGDSEAIFIALDRSRACVNEILTGIATEPNPELADRLRGLFIYVHNNLVRADLDRDVQFVRNAVRILEDHRRAWFQLLETVQSDRPDESVADASAATGRSWTT